MSALHLSLRTAQPRCSLLQRAQLERRLTLRGEARDSIERRLTTAGREMQEAECGGLFNRFVINDVLEQAYKDFEHAVLG